MMKTIVVISRNIVTINIAERVLSPFYKTVVFRNAASALDYIYDSLPHLIIIDLTAGDKVSTQVLKNNLKGDPMFQQLPVLAILDRKAGIPGWEDMFVEDFIWQHDIEDEFLVRANLSLLRSERSVEINPLTRLPGNISISRQIEGRLAQGEIFAFAYADLDYFKPFNDKYGFSRGDEVINATGRIIMNVVKSKQPQNSFIGHIGGDDFVYITDPAVVEETSAEIITAFDDFIPTLYETEDRKAGCILSVDRQGNDRTFPILSISIGITDNAAKRVSHYGQVVEAASHMKAFAKQKGGSVYCMDRRQGADSQSPED
ncbi:MAG: diguanylate cyclase [Smithellaceae bacterium]|nr:diguanylate cyclase [Smithellaceae bacterium]